MGERFWTTIDIGGDVTQDQHDALVQLMDDEGTETAPEVENDQLTANFPEVNYGDLTEIEEFCWQNKLPYHKTVAGKSGFDGFLYWWAPDGMTTGASGHCNVDDSGTLLIPIHVIRECLADGGSIEDLLNAAAPPELPPYRVVSR